MTRYLILVVVIVGLAECGGEPTPTASGRIASVSDRDGNLDIYVMNADGSGQTNLTNSPSNGWGAAWAP